MNIPIIPNWSCQLGKTLTLELQLSWEWNYSCNILCYFGIISFYCWIAGLYQVKPFEEKKSAKIEFREYLYVGITNQ